MQQCIIYQYWNGRLCFALSEGCLHIDELFRTHDHMIVIWAIPPADH